MPPPTPPAHSRIHPAALVSALTLYVLLVHGFHPFVEDGGLYIAGIKKLLSPSLYPYWTQFVTEHLRFSVFAPMVAALSRAFPLGLPAVLFLLYLSSIWLTLFAGWMLAARAVTASAARIGAVALLACWITLPIAGTSLMLMDPYVTARSFSTPLALFALAWALDATHTRHPRPMLLCAVAILVAAVLHPLMAGYALAAVAVLVCTASTSPTLRRFGPFLLLGVALLAATALQLKAPAESAAYLRVALTRYYWFPFRWEWYEQIGLLAPLVLLLFLARRPPASASASSPSQASTTSWATLTRTAVLLGLISLAIAVLFSRTGLATHLVARMQPLRCYQIVYELMILLLGAWVGERLLQRHAWRWATLLLAFGSLMFFVQRSTFPASDHLELPWRTPTNLWVQGFLWARQNTPVDALFAVDARYITRGPGEDAQTFRAIAERSALPDYSKDGGEASITPDLTDAWVIGQQAQTGLETMSDPQRIAALSPLHVTWIVLEARSPTQWSCPYSNNAVKVCRLP